MSKYVFGCTVKAVAYNGTSWDMQVVPMANYCVKRSVDGKTNTFATILPLDDGDVGFTVQYDKTIVVKLLKLGILCWNGTVEIEFEDSTTPSSSMGEIEVGQVNASNGNPHRFSITKLTMK